MTDDHLINRRQLLGGAAALGLSTLLPRTTLGRTKGIAFAEVIAAGTPAAMGEAHGKAAAAAIKRNVDFYVGWLATATGLAPRDLLLEAARFAPALAEYTPDLLEEIHGISRGSGRTVNEILAVNARTDLLVTARRKKKTKKSKATPGCTAVALMSRAKKSKAWSAALGQTWDWTPRLKGNQILLRLEPRSGPRLATFTEAGMVAKIGMNQHRLGVCLNFLSHPSDDPEGQVGIPVHCLLRVVLQCEDFGQALSRVFALPRCASACFTVAQQPAQGTPRAVCLELTPSAVGHLRGVRWTQGEAVLAHTNHFVTPALSLTTQGKEGPSSLNRLRQAIAGAQKLSRKVPHPATRMRKVLASRKGLPYCISRAGEADSHTLAGVVMDLTGNEMWLVAGAPHAGTWVRMPGV